MHSHSGGSDCQKNLLSFYVKAEAFDSLLSHPMILPSAIHGEQAAYFTAAVFTLGNVEVIYNRILWNFFCFFRKNLRNFLAAYQKRVKVAKNCKRTCKMWKDMIL